jgi:hypothetical protein
MNNAPANADSAAPPACSSKIASTTIAFLTRLSFSAPQDCASTSGPSRRVFNKPNGDIFDILFITAHVRGDKNERGGQRR